MCLASGTFTQTPNDVHATSFPLDWSDPNQIFLTKFINSYLYKNLLFPATLSTLIIIKFPILTLLVLMSSTVITKVWDEI